MARTSKTVVAPRGSTRGEVAIQEFANSNLPSEQLRQQAGPLLTSKELLRNVWGLPPEDQTKFVDKVDQVRRDRLLFPLEIIFLFLQRHIRPLTRKMRKF